jgi:hypothetical protein
MEDRQEFTPADRARVSEVLAAALDEMSDSYCLADMFAPHAQILRIAFGVPAGAYLLAGDDQS